MIPSILAFVYSTQILRAKKTRNPIISLSCFLIIELIFNNSFFIQNPTQNLFISIICTYFMVALLLKLSVFEKKHRFNFLVPLAVFTLVSLVFLVSATFNVSAIFYYFSPAQWFNNHVVSLFSNNFWGVLFLTIAASIFFWTGLPVPSSLSFRDYSLPSAISNLNASLDHHVDHLPFPLNINSLYYSFALFGGTAMTLAIVIAILFLGRKRNDDIVHLARISLLPSFMNSNQIMAFGIPLFLNPYFILPTIFSPLASVILGACFIKLKWITPAVFQLPAYTPNFLGAFISSNGDWRALLASVLILLVSVLIYLPFISHWLKEVNHAKNN